MHSSVHAFTQTHGYSMINISLLWLPKGGGGLCALTDKPINQTVELLVVAKNPSKGGCGNGNISPRF